MSTNSSCTDIGRCISYNAYHLNLKSIDTGMPVNLEQTTFLRFNPVAISYYL